MKSIAYLILIELISFSCNQKPKEVFDYKWRDSLQAENRKLKMKCDSLEGVYKHELFSIHRIDILVTQTIIPKT